MLWRIAVGGALVRSAVPAVKLIDEISRAASARSAKSQDGTTEQPTQARFIGEMDGTVTARMHSIVAMQMSPAEMAAFGVVSSVFTAAAVTAEAATNASAAATAAASRAANVACEAASKVAGSTSEATARLMRKVTNADVNAELKIQAERRLKILEELSELKEAHAYFDRMKAMLAVGIALAASDGNISPEEMDHIREFVGGAAHQALPPGVETALQEWLASPPSLETAYELALKCGPDAMPFFDNVIDVAIHADEVVHPSELAFKERWDTMREGVPA